MMRVLTDSRSNFEALSRWFDPIETDTLLSALDHALTHWVTEHPLV